MIPTIVMTHGRIISKHLRTIASGHVIIFTIKF